MMIAIGNTLISEDILMRYFVCDIASCQGACCVEGDAGAPLEPQEIDILNEIWPLVQPFIPESGVKAIEEQGTFVYDEDGDRVTPLMDGKHCAYTVFTPQGSAQCGIELAWKAGKIKFQKPISCHLYPIRITQLSDGTDALNYHRWQICKAACSHGENLKVPLYRFLREPLIRKYGQVWYDELAEVADAYLAQN